MSFLERLDRRSPVAATSRAQGGGVATSATRAGRLNGSPAPRTIAQISGSSTIIVRVRWAGSAMTTTTVTARERLVGPGVEARAGGRLTTRW